MSVLPFGGPVVELGDSTPCRPSVPLQVRSASRVVSRSKSLAGHPGRPRRRSGRAGCPDPYGSRETDTRSQGANRRGATPTPPTTCGLPLGAGLVSPHDGLEGRLRGLCRHLSSGGSHSSQSEQPASSHVWHMVCSGADPVVALVSRSSWSGASSSYSSGTCGTVERVPVSCSVVPGVPSFSGDGGRYRVHGSARSPTR